MRNLTVFFLLVFAPPAFCQTAVSTAAVSDVGSGPWLACEITASGLVNVKEKVVKKHVKAEKGDFYRSEYVSKDIQSLIGLGNFERASVDITATGSEQEVEGKTYPCHKITYIVSERPVIKAITVDGRKKISKGTILDAMTLKEKDPYDQAKLAADMRKIEDKCGEKGYISAKADYEVSPAQKPGMVNVQVKIREGERSRVKAAAFFGLEGFPKKKILKKTRNRPGKVYSAADVTPDMAKIESYYKNHGYQDFRITDSTQTFSADGKDVYFAYWFSEGRKSKFGETAFSGNTVVVSSELVQTVQYTRGKIYQQDDYDDTVRAIQDRYADKGYLKMAVKPERKFNEATGELDINFNITENSVVYVDHVDISGNKTTKTKVFRRELVIKEGDVFRSSRVRRSIEKIMNLGFIDDVSPEITPTADPDKVDLNFDIAEGHPGNLTLGAAVSSSDGLYGEMSLSHLNLFGKAQKLSMTWRYGGRVLDTSISWTEPWFKDKPMSLGFDLFSTRRWRSYSSESEAYKEQRVGGRVRLGPRFEEDKYQLSLAYTLEKVRVYSIDDDYTDTITPGTSVTSSVSVEFAVDTRDSVWDPTRGWRNSVSLEVAGGPFFGEMNYYKTGLSSSFNKKLFSIGDYPFVWAVANRFGLMGRYGSTDETPLTEKYFLGGQDTVRGYQDTGQVGPSSGGKVYYVFNTELRFPIARERKRTIIQWAFFLDVGNAWQDLRDVRCQIGPGVRQLKMGAGFGLRFTTPAFPIRLDWGYGFNHKAGDGNSEFYITFGNFF